MSHITPHPIRIDGLRKTFGTTTAVDNVTVTIPSGEILALLGPSGCGKTTLLRLLSGFEQPDAGSIAIGDRIVVDDDHWVPPEHRNVGMVFQDHALFPHRSVAANIGFGVPRALRPSRVREVMELVGLTGLEDRMPSQLSGGQQQRVALARALAPEPGLVLLDEPWSSVDALLRESVRTDIITILREAGATVVLVTHDREEALLLADRVALMNAGRIVQAASPEELYTAPVDRWAAEFVGPGNILHGDVTDGAVATPIGSFPLRVPATSGSVVDALIRPEQIVLRPTADGSAEVVGREFRGHDVMYRVRLADDSVICAQRPSTEAVELGTRVALEPHRIPVTVFPRSPET